MKLDDKRKVIEVLLCASTENGDPISDVYEDLGYGRDVFIGARMEMDETYESQDALDLTTLKYEHIAAEAAYRLIESSPTLRREWFGAK